MHLVRLIAGYNTDLTPWEEADYEAVKRRDGENDIAEVSHRWFPVGRLSASRMA